MYDYATIHMYEWLCIANVLTDHHSQTVPTVSNAVSSEMEYANVNQSLAPGRRSLTPSPKSKLILLQDM